MEEKELQELEGALSRASPGPWQERSDEYICRVVDSNGWTVVTDDSGDDGDSAAIAALVNAAPSLISDIRSARQMLRRWTEADHCHGHICDSDPQGPCEVRRLEDETRAVLGNADASPPPDSSAALREARRLLGEARPIVAAEAAVYGTTTGGQRLPGLLARIDAFLGERSDRERSSPLSSSSVEDLK